MANPRRGSLARLAAATRIQRSRQRLGRISFSIVRISDPVSSYLAGTNQTRPNRRDPGRAALQLVAYRAIDYVIACPAFSSDHEPMERECGVGCRNWDRAAVLCGSVAA